MPLKDQFFFVGSEPILPPVHLVDYVVELCSQLFIQASRAHAIEADGAGVFDSVGVDLLETLSGKDLFEAFRCTHGLFQKAYRPTSTGKAYNIAVITNRIVSQNTAEKYSKPVGGLVVGPAKMRAIRSSISR